MGLPGGTIRSARLKLITVMLVLACLYTGCGNSSDSQPTDAASAVLKAGLQAQARGNFDAAVAEYETVLKLDPSNVLAHYNLGVIDQERGFITQSANEYQRALSARPDYVPALYNLATIEAARAPRQAQALYEKVIRLQPRDARAHLNLGLLLSSAGRAKAGNAQIADAFRLDPALRNSSSSAATTVPTSPASPS